MVSYYQNSDESQSEVASSEDISKQHDSSEFLESYVHGLMQKSKQQRDKEVMELQKLHSRDRPTDRDSLKLQIAKADLRCEKRQKNIAIAAWQKSMKVNQELEVEINGKEDEINAQIEANEQKVKQNQTEILKFNSQMKQHEMKLKQLNTDIFKTLKDITKSCEVHLKCRIDMSGLLAKEPTLENIQQMLNSLFESIIHKEQDRLQRMIEIETQNKQLVRQLSFKKNAIQSKTKENAQQKQANQRLKQQNSEFKEENAILEQQNYQLKQQLLKSKQSLKQIEHKKRKYKDYSRKYQGYLQQLSREYHQKQEEDGP